MMALPFVRLGRHDEAAADYATAMRLWPPFPEIYYNRGDLRLSTGDEEGRSLTSATRWNWIRSW
jgi:TPR repeat